MSYKDNCIAPLERLTGRCKSDQTTSMRTEQLADLTQPQRDRLAFIELRMRFIGDLSRQDLVTRFGIQSAAASRDMALYKEIAPGNIDYDAKGKSYIQGPSFQPVFDFPPERVLSWLTQGFGDGEPMQLKAWVASESPSRLTHPDLDVLASVTRAIHQECPLGIEYHSISSGRTEREIVPFALIDNGLRWHVRAFDRKSQECWRRSKFDPPCRLNFDPGLGTGIR